MKLVLLDYGAGNVKSIEHAFGRLGANTLRTNSARDLASAEAILLPGVGHFSALMGALNRCHLRTPLMESIARGVPFLGICLGLQALCAGSDEAADIPGLGLFAARVERLPATAKLPHMGWNQVSLCKPSRLLCGLPENSFFYFAHSYALVAAQQAVVATSFHAARFAAVLEHENIFALQFHPEKSAAAGSRVLQNFLVHAVASASPPV